MSLQIDIQLLDVQRIRSTIGIPALIATSAIAAAVLVSLPSFHPSRTTSNISALMRRTALSGSGSKSPLSRFGIFYTLLGVFYAFGAVLAIIDGGLVESNFFCSFSYLFVLLATICLCTSFFYYVSQMSREKEWRSRKCKPRKKTMVDREEV